MEEIENSFPKALSNDKYLEVALELTKLAVTEKKFLGRHRQKIVTITTANEIAQIFRSYYSMLETGEVEDPIETLKRTGKFVEDF